MLKYYVRNLLMFVGFLAIVAGFGILTNGLDVYLGQPYLVIRLIATAVVALIANWYLAKKEYEQKEAERKMIKAMEKLQQYM